MTNQNKSYIFALSAIFLWSTVAVAFKISLRYVSFLQLLLYSSAVAVISFFIITSFQKNTAELFKISKKNLFLFGINGFLNPFLYYLVLFKAYSLLPAQIAQPLNYLWPVMLVLLSVPLLGQSLKLKSIIALILGFCGVFVISTQGNIFELKIESPTGVFLAAGSSLIWALSWILNQKNKTKNVIKLFWNFVFGFIYIFTAVILFSELKIPPVKGIISVIYVGLFEMGITFFFWMKALELTDRNDKISNLVFLSPFLALFFIYFILNENIYLTTIIGLIFIIIGIFIQQIKTKRVKK